MLRFTDDQLASVLDLGLRAREYLIQRGMAPGDALVAFGCMVGTMLSGGAPGDPSAR